MNRICAGMSAFSVQVVTGCKLRYPHKGSMKILQTMSSQQTLASFQRSVVGGWKLARAQVVLNDMSMRPRYFRRYCWIRANKSRSCTVQLLVRCHHSYQDTTLDDHEDRSLFSNKGWISWVDKQPSVETYCGPNMTIFSVSCTYLVCVRCT